MLRIIIKSFLDFFRDNGLQLAGSLSYFSMMAFVPFCLLIAAAFGYVLGENEEILIFFTSEISAFFPEITQDITEEFKKIIRFYRGLGILSLVLYAVLSYQLFASMESAINVVFKSENRRPFPISLILSFFLITLILIFIFLSFSMTSVISMLKVFQESLPLQIGKISGFIISFIAPFILVLLTATAIYTLLPRKKVRLRHALAGGLFTALLLEAAKHLFTFYVVKVVKFGAIYGPLSAFIIFLFWVFYSSCIYLIGAEVVHNLEVSRKKRRS